MSTLIIEIALCLIIGYLIGGINPAFILAKIRGFDIRSQGSGNAGASNAVITMGKITGVLCALFDIMKAYLAVKLCLLLFPVIRVSGIVAGSGCIVGHIYPFTMHFRGGKGLATLGGVILAHDARFFVCILLMEVVIVLVLRYICFVAVSGSIIFSIYLLLVYGAGYALTFVPIVFLLAYSHRLNFMRIRYGVEARFSYLWDKENERNRIRENRSKLTEEQQLFLKTKAFD